MKRTLENPESEEDPAPKRFKMFAYKEDDYEEPALPSDALQIIMKYACYHDAKTSMASLRSAKAFEALVDAEAWKSLYIRRWHRRIFTDDAEKFKNVFEEMEKVIRTDPSEYVEEQFFHEKDAWKNRYKHRAQLEREGRKLAQINPTHFRSSVFNETSIAIYRVPPEKNIVHANLTKIEEHNKKTVLEMHEEQGTENFVYEDPNEEPFEENRKVYQAIIIGHTGAPVKIRVEYLPDENYGGVQKMYCNLRLLAFNEKNQVWNIIAAHHTNMFVEEDEINYYMPYYGDVCSTLFYKQSLNNENSRTARSGGVNPFLREGVYKVLVLAANVNEMFRSANTDSDVTLLD